MKAQDNFLETLPIRGDKPDPWGVPEAAIQYCLSIGGVTCGDIDVVAIASDPFHGWRRRALSRRCLSLVAPVDTGYQQGEELSRLVKEWTGIRVLRQVDAARILKEVSNLYAKIGWKMLKFAYSLIQPTIEANRATGGTWGPIDGLALKK